MYLYIYMIVEVKFLAGKCSMPYYIYSFIIINLTFFFMLNMSGNDSICREMTSKQEKPKTKQYTPCETSLFCSVVVFYDRGYSFERNGVLRRWESETLK